MAIPPDPAPALISFSRKGAQLIPHAPAVTPKIQAFQEQLFALEPLVQLVGGRPLRGVAAKIEQGRLILRMAAASGEVFHTNLGQLQRNGNFTPAWADLDMRLVNAAAFLLNPQGEAPDLSAPPPAPAAAPTPPSGPSTTPPSGPSTTPPSGPSTTPPSGPSTTPPSGPSTTPPSGPSTTPPADSTTASERAPMPLAPSPQHVPLPLPPVEPDLDKDRLDGMQSLHTGQLAKFFTLTGERRKEIFARYEHETFALSQADQPITDRERAIPKNQIDQFIELRTTHKTDIEGVFQRYRTAQKELFLDHLEQQRAFKRELLNTPDKDPLPLIQSQQEKLKQLQVKEIADYEIICARQLTELDDLVTRQIPDRLLLSQNMQLLVRRQDADIRLLVTNHQLNLTQLITDQQTQQTGIQNEQLQELTLPAIQARVTALDRIVAAAGNAVREADETFDQAENDARKAGIPLPPGIGTARAAVIAASEQVRTQNRIAIAARNAVPRALNAAAAMLEIVRAATAINQAHTQLAAVEAALTRTKQNAAPVTLAADRVRRNDKIQFIAYAGFALLAIAYKVYGQQLGLPQIW